MFNVVLVQPEIPPNTGNIIRLCANTGARLHLVRPLGFPIDHAKMRRAGLDYHEFASVAVHDNWDAFVARESPASLYALTTRGMLDHCSVQFRAGDYLVFGSETAGLPAEVFQQFPPERRIRLPMRPDNRSLNLSNAVAITVYEAWRQNDFEGAARIGPG
jgi:tRNA (cytidine/uridine-2'-O-)-methyltransferase